MELNDYFSSTGKSATSSRIKSIESNLNRRLPDQFRDLIMLCGGGRLKSTKKYLPGTFGQGWPSGLLVDTVLGDGTLPTGENISLDARLGSNYLIAEWGHPDIGIVFGLTEAGGEDALIINTDSEEFPYASILLANEFEELIFVAPSVDEFFLHLTAE